MVYETIAKKDAGPVYDVITEIGISLIGILNGSALLIYDFRIKNNAIELLRLKSLKKYRFHLGLMRSKTDMVENRNDNIEIEIQPIGRATMKSTEIMNHAEPLETELVVSPPIECKTILKEI